MTNSLLILIALSLPMVASAQSVWRCGPDGRSFSDTPCTNGRPLDVAMVARPVEDVRAAQVQADRDIHLAETMRRERLAQETLQRGSGLAALGPQAARVRLAKPERSSSTKLEPKLRRQPHSEAQQTWRAVAPVSRRAKD